MFRSFDKRSQCLERLDTGDYTPAEYAKWQREMRLINRFLGDTRSLRLSLRGEMRNFSYGRVSVLDVGAGSGEMLKAARETIGDRPLFLVGAEVNADAARSINDLAFQFGIRGVQCDALKLPFADNSFDFAISSLFLHHLNETDATTLIKEMSRVAKRGFFIIDLHRHAAAYHLYRIFGRLFLQRFTLEDGSLSILRSFRPGELLRLARMAGVRDAVVTRRAAFRLVLSGTKSINAA